MFESNCEYNAANVLALVYNITRDLRNYRLFQDAGVHALSNVCHVDIERISKRKPGEVVGTSLMFVLFHMKNFSLMDCMCFSCGEQFLYEFMTCMKLYLMNCGSIYVVEFKCSIVVNM